MKILDLDDFHGVSSPVAASIDQVAAATGRNTVSL